MNYKKHKDIDVKQYASEEPTDYWRNKKGNEDMPRNKWQWKHDNSKPVGWIKAMLRGKLTRIQAYLKKQEKQQLKNLTSHLKQLVKED